LAKRLGIWAIAEVLAHDAAVLALDQGIVVGLARARLGELADLQLVEQGGDAMVDVLRAVVGVKAEDGEGKVAEQLFEHGSRKRSLMRSTAPTNWNWVMASTVLIR